MITVAIVEDNAGLRRSLEMLLADSPGYRCTGAYSSAEDALREIPKKPPMVVLMDINLPNMSGIECTRLLREALPELRVVIVTIYGDNEKIFKALRAGASGYLLKRSSPETILQAITDVRQGGAPMSSDIARKVIETFQQPLVQPVPDAELSTREKEVLEFLMQGLPDKEIAAKLFISFPTVRYHLNNIYTKLHVRSRTEVVIKINAGTKPGMDQTNT